LSRYQWRTQGARGRTVSVKFPVFLVFPVVESVTTGAI
jgi:hypothetical protein